jgi:hypothetical protein
MAVGVCVIELLIPASTSLKDKRRVVRAVVARVRNAYNVSVAEVDHLDSWQLATLEVACAAHDADYAHGLLGKVVAFIENSHLDCVLLAYSTEIV